MKRIALLMLASAMVVGAVDGRSKTPARTTETETDMTSAHSMSLQSANLFLLDDLQDTKRTSKLAEADLNALRAVADWINSFVTRPHKDLGRAGPVCPFVPAALQHKTLWLAPERIAGKSASDVVRLTNGYKKLLLNAQPIDGDAADSKTIVLVFTDLSADRARDVFDNVLENLGVSSYAQDGLVLGGFYEGNEGSAIYNSSFQPFQSPVPLLLVRRAVVSDWKFFLNNQALLNLWARRYGESGVQVLAEELRHLPWNARQQ